MSIRSLHENIFMRVVIMTALLFGAFISTSWADDIVVFAADENDVQAFDRLLAVQNTKPQASQGKSSAAFGKVVREEAKKLHTLGEKGRDMGAWVSEQRRQNSSNRGKGNDASNAASSERGQMSDMRGFISEKKGGGGGNGNANGHNNGNNGNGNGNGNN